MWSTATVLIFKYRVSQESLFILKNNEN